MVSLQHTLNESKNEITYLTTTFNHRCKSSTFLFTFNRNVQMRIKVKIFKNIKMKNTRMKNISIYNGIIIQRMESLYRFIGDDFTIFAIF